MLNNWRYVHYPLVKNWKPRLINSAAIARNKIEIILGAHNKAVPKNRLLPKNFNKGLLV